MCVPHGLNWICEPTFQPSSTYQFVNTIVLRHSTYLFNNYHLYFLSFVWTFLTSHWIFRCPGSRATCCIYIGSMLHTFTRCVDGIPLFCLRFCLMTYIIIYKIIAKSSSGIFLCLPQFLPRNLIQQLPESLFLVFPWAFSRTDLQRVFLITHHANNIPPNFFIFTPQTSVLTKVFTP